MVNNSDNPIIYVFANFLNASNITISVYKFDESALLLKEVEMQNVPPLSCSENLMVSNNTGRFFIFGQLLLFAKPDIYSNEINIYDSSINIWNTNVKSLIGDLILSYSATFLDRLILYIGGCSGTFMNPPSNSVDEYSFSTVNFDFFKNKSFNNKIY